MKREFLVFSYRYSVRNLARNKRRTILTLVTVGTTLAISMIASRYASAVLDLWKDGAIDTGTAHIQFHKQGYWEKQEGVDPDLNLVSPNDLEEQLSQDQSVDAWVRRFRFEGLIANDSASTHFLATAVDPDKELAVSPRMFNPPYDQGRFVDKDARASAAIGRGLASLLKLNIGDQATLIAQTGQGSVNAIDIEVVGIVDVPLPNFSKHALYLNIDHARKLLRLPGEYNELAVRLKPGVDPEPFLHRYKYSSRTKGIDARGWWDVEPIISKIERIWLAVSGLLCTLLLLSTSLTVVNVIFIMVNERIVEIGTLMAIGAKPSMVRLMFAMEGAVIGATGGLLGCVVGNLVISVMGRVGIPFESPFGSGIEMIHPQMDLGWTVVAFFSATVACALCSVPPAGRAARVDPVVAFRNIV